MTKYKKILCLVMALSLCLLSVACGKTEDISVGESSVTSENTDTEIQENDIKYSSVKILIDSMMSERDSGTLNSKRLWDEYISQTTKDINFIDGDTFVSTVAMQLVNDTYVSHEIEKIDLIEEKYAVAKYNVTIRTQYGVEQIVKYKDYFVKENDGNWKILLLGVTDFDSYVSKGEEDKIKVTKARVYKTLAGIQVDYTIANRSSANYRLGWTDSPTVELETSVGEYEVKYDNIRDIPAYTDFESSCFFKDATGDVVELRVRNTYELGENSIPVNVDSYGKTLRKTFDSSEIEEIKSKEDTKQESNKK